MKKKSVVVCSLIIMMMVVMASGALALGPWGGKARTPEKRIERLAKELGLTAQQKEKYLAAAKAGEAAAQEIRAKNKELYAKIEQELLKDAPDIKIINPYIFQISQNNASIQTKRMEQLIQLRKELTPEQKTKLAQLMEKNKFRGKREGQKKGR